MTYRDLLTIAKKRFNECGIETPQLDSELLLMDLLNLDRFYLFLHSENEALPQDIEEYLRRVDLRANGMPVQHIIGKQEFMGLEFLVNENVLIPRQETEVLVETAIQKIRSNNEKTIHEILDMCTGSGAIALSIAHYIPDASVIAVDASEQALETAKANAQKLGLTERVKFIHGDMFKAVADKKFDMILSNPPYIRTDEISGLMKEVKDHDPAIALDGGEDGLRFYRIIAVEAPKHIRKDGWLILEIGHDQSKAVKELLMNTNHFSDISTLQDLAGIDRIVVAKKV